MAVPCEQREKMHQIEQNVALTNKDISYMKNQIGDIKHSQEEMIEKMDHIIERFESKFASKRVERVVKWMIGIILITVFTAMLSIVIIK